MELIQQKAVFPPVPMMCASQEETAPIKKYLKPTQNIVLFQRLEIW
jgi:hypothetical protein